MRNLSWLWLIRLCLAVLCITAVGTTGGVVAHQRGDASPPATESGGDWADLGTDFISPADTSGTTDIVGDMYVLPSSGAEVVVGDGVIASDPAESSFEDQVIVTLPDGIGAVAVVQGLGYPLNVLESYVGGFGESMDSVVEVDVQSDRYVATGLYQVDIGGQLVYLYISVDAASYPGHHLIQVVVVEGDSLADSIELLRANVAVNGIPMFADTDEHAVQDLVVRHMND